MMVKINSHVTEYIQNVQRKVWTSEFRAAPYNVSQCFNHPRRRAVLWTLLQEAKGLISQTYDIMYFLTGSIFLSGSATIHDYDSSFSSVHGRSPHIPSLHAIFL
jgi:hypothetical protein